MAVEGVADAFNLVYHKTSELYAEIFSGYGEIGLTEQLEKYTKILEWLVGETEIKDRGSFLLKFDLLSIQPQFEETREIPLERLELAILSESSLKKDWLTPEEDDAWADL